MTVIILEDNDSFVFKILNFSIIFLASRLVFNYIGFYIGNAARQIAVPVKTDKIR